MNDPKLHFTKLCMEAVEYYSAERINRVQNDKLFEFLKAIDGIKLADIVINTGVVRHCLKPYAYFIVRKNNKIIKNIHYPVEL